MRRGLKASLILLLLGALVATAGCSARPLTFQGGGQGGPAGATAGSGGTPGGGGSMGIAGSGGGAGGDAGTTGIAGGGGGAGGDPGTTGIAGGGGHAAGSGGGPGTGGMGTGGSLPAVAELFPEGTNGSLDGRLVTIPCGDENTSGTDCLSAGAYHRGFYIPCAAGALNVLQTFPVGGAPGVSYRVTVHFYGILGPKNYGPRATREAVTGRPGNQNSGAIPTPWATAPAGHTYPVSDYDTYEIRVDDQAEQEVAAYYLNADSGEGHWTYVINFEKQIDVIGGGRIRVRTFDRNCRQIKNCGPNGTPAQQCAEVARARIIDVSAASPAPPAAPAEQGGLQQPSLNQFRTAGASGQWTLIDVVSVDSIVP